MGLCQSVSGTGVKNMRTIRGVRVINKRVLVRVDFDVAMDKNNQITDGFRIAKSLPTIDYLIKNKAKVILMSHLGRPKAGLPKDRKKFGLEPVVKYIQKNYGLKIKFIDDCVGKSACQKINVLKNGEVALLENLRFYQGEEKNDLKFAKSLASLADIYVNDGFGASHRKHASYVGITKFIPSYAGLLLEKEVSILSKILKNPQKPAVAIIGGVKLETKLPLIKSLAEKYDYILIGGRIGLKIKPDNKKIILPADYRGKNKFDIGEKTIVIFKEIIKKAKTIVWNGPMGMFENKRFETGTKEIGIAIAKSKAFKVAGGGDTIAALDKYKLFNKMDFVSTGGGAMLEFLGGDKLPGIEALKNK